MSLTSYRAAPPRVKLEFVSARYLAIAQQLGKLCKSGKPVRTKSRRVSAAAFRSKIVKRETVLGRPGSDLLSQVLRLSTIGAQEFNGRVRNGIGFRLPAKTTRPAKDSLKQAFGSFLLIHAPRAFARGH